MSPFWQLVRRDLLVAWRDGTTAGVALGFYLVVVVLLPLGLGPDLNLLSRIAPGVLWIALLLSALLSLGRLFETDYEDGALDILKTGPLPLEGVAAAKALAHAPVDVVMIDRRNHHVFSPLLYQVATAGLSPGDIASPIRWILRRQNNVQVWLADATAIDTARRVVRLTDGEVSYDFLILAAGSTHAYFGHDAWRPHAPGLKTLEDALDIRRRVLLSFEQAEREPDRAAQRRLLTFVVVGGGPTGVELAGALAEISRHALANDFRAIDPESARIILVEGGPDVLPAYPGPLSAFARRALERLGVSVWTGSLVTGVEAGKADNAARLQPLIEMAGRAIVRWLCDRRIDDDAARPRRRGHVHRLDVFFIRPDIADMREGEGDDLAGIGRVGEDFLISRHCGVEADLADGGAGGAEADAFEDGAVGQHEKGRRCGLGPGGIVLFGAHERPK